MAHSITATKKVKGAQKKTTLVARPTPRRFQINVWAISACLLLGAYLAVVHRPAPAAAPAVNPPVSPVLLNDTVANENDRLPNNDSFQKWPLWYPKIDIQAASAANGNVDLAVDSRNIVHTIYQSTTSGPTHAVHYKNDRFESRGASGFSGSFTVASTGERPEIAVDAQDNVHAIWSVVETGVRVLKYRHFDRSSGSWSTAFSITDSDSHMDYPHLETDASNIVHIAYVRLDAAGGNATQVRYIKSNQAKPTQASHYNASERVDNMPTNSVPKTEKPRLDIDSSSFAHIAWIDSGTDLVGAGQDQTKVVYSNRTSGSWSTPIRISPNVSGEPAQSCDLATPTTSLQHFVWEIT